MRRIQFILFILLLTSTGAQAQDQATYDRLVEEARALYEAKDPAGSARTYSEAFKALGWKGTANDRYNAACSYALCGIADSAYVHLFRIAERMDYSYLSHLTSDSDLNSLHSDPRWEQLVLLVKANKEQLDANLDRPLAALLDSLFEEDQGLRRQIGEVEARYGSESPEMQDLWRRMAEKDSLNLIVVKHILDERGWLGPDVVGEKGSSTLFLVIQHSDLATQEKYLPLMREAVAKGNARASSLALLEDRVALGQGRRQTYGSQIGFDEETGASFLLPLEDPDQVDERRASMGLGPLKEYLMHFGLAWDVEAYKRELPLIEERQKARRR
ncbi:MAG TPA: hypothetical protein PLN54_13725 [Flavobacteriales bacterium]|nr:hypothetical protein [Flavobacteriales bacterium]